MVDLPDGLSMRLVPSATGYVVEAVVEREPWRSFLMGTVRVQDGWWLAYDSEDNPVAPVRALTADDAGRRLVWVMHAVVEHGLQESSNG